ncbi:MAG TPA: molybdopterin molybdotransferase MoeA [Acidobacteriota bacterium]|jgi:molybdopterin molybdotransferase|nr:molybdopterin molybdotransferase MoeA [Acidobacteriota bacterium]HNT17877.1 molybdopterin molybdotransferase MoeA [Acidobacteriota bacterium]
MKSYIPVAEALKIILSHARPAKEELVKLEDALGRYLARDVAALHPNPPSDNSAMDGYGVRVSDVKAVPATLKVAGSVFAGQAPGKPIRRGEAIEIMTGAPIPEGVDAVIPVEETERCGTDVMVLKKPEPRQHIRKKGEDYEKGDLLASRGTRLTPAHIALMASAGRGGVKAFRKPKIAVLSTGNELVEPGRPLGRGKIYESNSFGICAQVEVSGGIPVKLKAAADDPAVLRKAVLEGLKQDALVVSGGISMGKADYLREVMEGLGARFHFVKVRQRPGNPMTFATIGRKPVFLLPGNPVSAPLCFEIYVRGFLEAVLGNPGGSDDTMSCVMGETIRVKKGKTYFLRVVVKRSGKETAAFLTGPQGSGILTSMSRADGILVVPEGSEEITKGSVVAVRPFSWRTSC